MNERHAMADSPKEGFPQTRLVWKNKKIEGKKRAEEIILELRNRLIT